MKNNYFTIAFFVIAFITLAIVFYDLIMGKNNISMQFILSVQAFIAVAAIFVKQKSTIHK